MVGGGALSCRHCPACQGDTVGVCAAKRGLAELAFSLSLAAGACVRVWYDHPAPQALSPSQCPQLSTFVRDRKGRVSVPVKWAVLPKCPNPTQAARLGGAGPWRFGWRFSQLGLRGSEPNSCRISPMTQAEGGRDGGRERFRWPECTPGRPLTHSL